MHSDRGIEGEDQLGTNLEEILILFQWKFNLHEFELIM